MKVSLKKAFVGPLLIFLTLLLGYAVADQPIQYSHKKHLTDVGLTCDFCHQNYTKGEVAGRPQTETCLICHQEPITDSPEEEKIRSYAKKQEEIPWERVYLLPTHVFFSHRRHVVAGEFECNTCHGNMADLDKPPEKTFVKLSMDWCLKCHTKHMANTDCNACHR